MRRSKFSLPLRFTISQLMILTAVVGLAMAPLAMIRKDDRIEFIVAMVAFELIGLPALLTIILLSTMKPGSARLKTIVFLSLLPTLLISTAVGLYYIVGFPFFLRTCVSGFVAGDFRHLRTLCLFVIQFSCLILSLSSRFLTRCPMCHRRRLYFMRSSQSTVGEWAVAGKCQECGKRLSRKCA
ncbi:hypothetical protein [Singulisphaera acidiphila]|uniref:Uncharacterized protein n=1 Tax=Singulisphaera acidiphila (strain ATCC BAA-1392 / DSM 18658 / VKM B-2454 / MOB10) TaxID=886293 RepID=L0DKE2_SINAD|nr:hypothetical protein [Singulisphaera acidiphila]AGA29305.1 hypothetical protein Sinac_5153 [Singulisphaera acidiphila DSM 18658]